MQRREDVTIVEDGEDATPSITLGKRKFFIPELAIKQSRIIVPLVQSLNGTKDFMEEKPFGTLTMLCLTALTRAYQITPAEFEEMPITLNEMLEAFPVITIAAGLVRKGAEIPAGEAPAGEVAAQSIGTA